MLEIELGHTHGSCVDFDGKSILAIGPSGSGKSSLALALIGLGGTLVSDDQVVLSESENGVYVSTHAAIAGKIEARGIGILRCPHVDTSRLNLVADLSTAPDDRMPARQTVKIGSHHVDLIAGEGVANLPIAARLLNLYGRDQEVGLKA
jgi:HPr kinase/phosphorylase